MSGLAVGSLAIAAGSAALSFSEASKAKRLQYQAQNEAELAMAEAKKRLDINVYEKLGIAKLPYEQAREAALVQGAMSTEAGRESERGAAATAGRVQMAQQEQQMAISAKQEQELVNLAKLVATEEGRLLDIGTQLNLEEVAGAQQAAAQYEEQKAKATQQGVQSAASAVQQGLALVPLFSKTGSERQTNKLLRETSKEGMTQEQLQNKLAEKGSFGNIDLSGVGYSRDLFNKELEIKKLMAEDPSLTREMAEKLITPKMSPLQFRDYLNQQSRSDLKKLREAYSGMTTDYF